MFVAIVPAYNEEGSIGPVVRDLFGHVDHVVVVDDGSTDSTLQNAKDAGATVLRHEMNRGQGAALQTGHDHARSMGAEYVLHFDGDGQFSVDDILPAYEALKSSGAQILFGSRLLDDRSNTPWTKRYIIFPIARLIHRLFGGTRLRDVHNGFRIIHRDALNKIVVTQDRMAHATEIPALVRKHNLPFIEFPVQVRYHEYGQNVRGGIEVVKDLGLGLFLKKD